jgi:hypothetical protein
MNSQDKYDYLTATTETNMNPTSTAYSTNTIIGTSTGTTISPMANNSLYSNGLNTTYTVDIPDGEVTLDELNRAMKILSNAVDHVKTKIAVMESIEEKSKCKPRKLNI